MQSARRSTASGCSRSTEGRLASTLYQELLDAMVYATQDAYECRAQGDIEGYKERADLDALLAMAQRLRRKLPNAG